MFRYRCVGHPLVFPGTFFFLFTLGADTVSLSLRDFRHDQWRRGSPVLSSMYILDIPTPLAPSVHHRVHAPPSCTHMIVLYEKKDRRLAAGTDCRRSAASQSLTSVAVPGAGRDFRTQVPVTMRISDCISTLSTSLSRIRRV